MSCDLTLVVGATGHVGSQVVKLLAEKGMPVRALVRKPDARVHGAPESVQYVRGDITDAASLDTALKGVKVAVSTAMPSSPVKRATTWLTSIRAAMRHSFLLASGQALNSSFSHLFPLTH